MERVEFSNFIESPRFDMLNVDSSDPPVTDRSGNTMTRKNRCPAVSIPGSILFLLGAMALSAPRPAATLERKLVLHRAGS